MSKQIFDYTVLGRFDFPLDMLRYDACWPVRSEDASDIRQSVQPLTADSRTDYVIRLRSHNTKLTVDRWRSFGWTVEGSGVGRMVV